MVQSAYPHLMACSAQPVMSLAGLLPDVSKIITGY